MSQDPEVLVVGGGPAGLASAISAALSGFSVAVAEPVGQPIDKCCGEGLLPGAVFALEQLGIPRAQLAAAGQQLRGIRFVQGGRLATAGFAAPALGVRRTVLHALLHQRAAALGITRIAASARHCPTRGPLHSQVEVQVGERTLRPRWLIGADGSQSTLRRSAGLGRGHIASRRFALRQHFELAPGVSPSPYVEVHWAHGVQAYVTPVGGRRVGVAVLSRDRQPSIDSAMALFPALRAQLSHAEACSTARGAVTQHQSLRRVTSGSTALVGDAAGSVDAITGDGLSLSFLSALALGPALQKNQLALYEAEHRRLFRLPRAMSRTLLAMGAHPALTTSAMALLGHVPLLFSALLRLHTAVDHPMVHHILEDTTWQTAPISTRSTT